MEKIKLGDCATFINGYAFKPADWKGSGIPIIRIQDLTGSMNKPNYYDGELNEKYIINNGDILISWSGSLGVYEWNKGKSYLNQHIFKVEFDKIEIDKKYFVYLINSKLREILKNVHGSTMKHITKSDFDKIEVNLPSLDKQTEIAVKLDKVQEVINKRKKQIKKLDEIVKSQFVEMFGNPVSNDRELNCIEMPLVCEIIDGDRGKHYPKSKEFFKNEYCLFLNAKNVTSTGFSFENCIYITKEKDEKLRKGKLQRGDVVLTTRGTVGNLAFYTEDIPFENIRINSGMVILRMRKDIINEIFFIEQFKMQLENIKNKITNGSAQPQLPIAKMNGIKILTPNIELQNKFADIVKQINKQKTEIQKSLQKVKELQESLINRYFYINK